MRGTWSKRAMSWSNCTDRGVWTVEASFGPTKGPWAQRTSPRGLKVVP